MPCIHSHRAFTSINNNIHIASKWPLSFFDSKIIYMQLNNTSTLYSCKSCFILLFNYSSLTAASNLISGKRLQVFASGSHNLHQVQDENRKAKPRDKDSVDSWSVQICEIELPYRI